VGFVAPTGYKINASGTLVGKLGEKRSLGDFASYLDSRCHENII
jgi:hypothetical protein